MASEGRRVRLHWCPECQRDYPATKWHVEGIWYRPGVTGYLCPRGHHQKVCDWGIHDWAFVDEIGEECRDCGAWRVRQLALWDGAAAQHERSGGDGG